MDDMMKPAKLSDIYYFGIEPTINFVAADMDDMSLDYPTQGMFESMLDRIEDHMIQMYPDEFQTEEASVAEQSDPRFRPRRRHFRRRVHRELLAALLFKELMRRRHRMR